MCETQKILEHAKKQGYVTHNYYKIVDRSKPQMVQMLKLAKGVK